MKLWFLRLCWSNLSHLIMESSTSHGWLLIFQIAYLFPSTKSLFFNSNCILSRHIFFLPVEAIEFFFFLKRLKLIEIYRSTLRWHGKAQWHHILEKVWYCHLWAIVVLIIDNFGLNFLICKMGTLIPKLWN